MGLDLTPGKAWRRVGASVRGTLHAVAGEPCADACAVQVFTDGRKGSLLVAVAADGAGTAERAGEGSRLACASILQEAEEWHGGMASARSGMRGLASFGRDETVRWVEGTRRRISETAAGQGMAPRDFSCTLLVALVDEGWGVFFQIGDGAIVYRDRDYGYQPALWPQSGEYANCTWFVTDEDAATRVQSRSVEGVHEVALLTDGLQGLALRLQSREAHAPFFEPLFAHLRGERLTASPRLAGELDAFLDSPAVNQRTGDDKTLVLATRLRARAKPRRRSARVRR